MKVVIYICTDQHDYELKEWLLVQEQETHLLNTFLMTESGRLLSCLA